MNVQEIKKLLVEDKKLDAVQVERVSGKIEALTPDIREALENWLTTGTVASPEYAGYDVNAILKAQPRMNVLGAYLSLDWLRRDPVAAKKSIERIIVQRI